MNMTLDEMKLAVCDKLPKLLLVSRDYISNHCIITSDKKECVWRDGKQLVNWTKEGLQVCHEAEKLLSYIQRINFVTRFKIQSQSALGAMLDLQKATYEERMEHLCRVWFPEKWK